MEKVVWDAVLSNVKLPSLLQRRPVRRNTDSPFSSDTRNTEGLPLVTEFVYETDDTIYEDRASSTITFGEDFFSSDSPMSAIEHWEGDTKTLPGYRNCESSIIFYDAIEDIEKEEQDECPLDIIQFYEAEQPYPGPVPLSQAPDLWRGHDTVSFSEEIKMV
jgi:hypothetical protein